MGLDRELEASGCESFLRVHAGVGRRREDVSSMHHTDGDLKKGFILGLLHGLTSC